jgi:hypothetical protein
MIFNGDNNNSFLIPKVYKFSWFREGYSEFIGSKTMYLMFKL